MFGFIFFLALLFRLCFSDEATTIKPEDCIKEDGVVPESKSASSIPNVIPISPTQAPFQVLILSTEAPGAAHVCSGAIYNRRHIITAAHCLTNRKGIPLEPQSITVFLGKSNLTISGADEVKLGIIETRIHPSFSKTETKPVGDIGIIRLNQSFQYNEKRQSIKLATETILNDKTMMGEITGWGIAETRSSRKFENSSNSSSSEMNNLKRSRVSIIQNSECEKSYKEMLGIGMSDNSSQSLPQSPATTFPNDLICAVARNGPTACQGQFDTGSPLACNRGGIRYLCGIGSTSIPCANGFPLAFTNILIYKEFIENYVEYTD